MIAELMEACQQAGVTGDAVLVRDETMRLDLSDGVLIRAASQEAAGASLRVFQDGRCGWAGASEGAASPAELLEAARASAASGEQLTVHLPRPAPLPAVATADEETATVPLPELQRIGSGLAERLRGDGRRVLVSVERALGEVAVANTRGVDARYETTLATIGVEVQAALGDVVVILRDALAGVMMPTTAELDALVADLERRLRWGEVPASPPPSAAPVLLMPRAVRQVLRPVERALVAGDPGTSGPLAGALGEQRFAAGIHVDDAPLLPGRPGSRPVDDDGVATRRQPLVEAGVVRQFLADLVTGAALGRPSTGSAHRTTFGPSRPGFSNLVLHAGTHGTRELLGALGDGLVVDDLTSGAGAVAAGGTFRFPVVSGYRVQGGEPAGRVEGVAISGNAFDVLARVLEIGSEQRWVGSALLPPIMVEGIEVGAR